jgi:hypothetical protein
MQHCPHDRLHETTVCEHLRADPDLEFGVRFSGVGCEHALLCKTCLDLPSPALARTCRTCFESGADYPWVLSIQGAPEVRTRPSSLRFRQEPLTIGSLPGAAPLQVAPLPGHGACLSFRGGRAVQGELVEEAPVEGVGERSTP